MNTTWRWPDFLLKPAISLFLLFAYSIAGAIPLPGHAIAQSKGLSAGMGVGVLQSSNCKTLWSWAGHGDYSYSSNISGGASIKFVGGNLDSINNLVNQRYSVNAKFMFNEPKYVLFAGPIFSFENTDLGTLRNEFTNFGDDDGGGTRCSRMYEEIGSSIGYQSGASLLLAPDWAVSVGHNLDLTFSGSFIASISMSIAFNLRNQFEKFKDNTKNLWLSLESSTSMSKNSSVINNFILGVALGF